MKIIQYLIVTILAISILTVSTNLSAKNTHENHGTHNTKKLSQNHGELWDVGKALQTGMENIRDATKVFIEISKKKSPSQEDAVTLKNTINQQINYMAENCKLSSRADESLHVFFANFLEGSQLIIENPNSKDGLMKIKHSIHQYPNYFNHPNW